MSKWMYISQVILIAGVLYVLVRRQPVVLRLQVIAWAIGVIGIWWRFGEAQLGFYSNDQNHYVSILNTLLNETWPRDPQWWLEFSKIPYPLVAYPLALAGIHTALALKTISAVCMLALAGGLLRHYQTTWVRSQTRTLYFTGCGLIGTFFSLLCLRETMMMYFVYRYVTDKSLVGRCVSLLVVFLLRSHLAAALVLAEVLVAMWNSAGLRRRLGYGEPLTLITVGVTVGVMIFSWRLANIYGLDGFREVKTPFGGNFGIAETLQIASNFAGLQFLTAHEAFVRLSVSNLLFLRVVFSDTVLIPLGFTLACILLGPRLRERHKFTLLAFSIYVSIVTNTDFNSFRQNIPFMPLMGMVVLDALDERRLARMRSKEVGRAVKNQFSRL